MQPFYEHRGGPPSVTVGEERPSGGRLEGTGERVMYRLRLVLFVVVSVAAAIVHVGAAIVVIADLVERDPRLALALGPPLEIIIALTLFTMGSAPTAPAPSSGWTHPVSPPSGTDTSASRTSPRRSVDSSRARSQRLTAPP
jgi:hypothetical protein